jgi:uncharacterized membrane protein
VSVPINAVAIEWDASDLPGDWRAQIDRWERLNSVRTSAAVLAFALLLLSLALAAHHGRRADLSTSSSHAAAI